jgi:hypothetical protein
MSTRSFTTLIRVLALPTTALAGQPWSELDVESDGESTTPGPSA